MPEMMLQLAETGNRNLPYTWVPIGDSGVFIHDDYLNEMLSKKKGGFFRKLFKGIKKVSLIVPRRAFRTLVAINVRGMATKLKHAISKNESGVRSAWESVGGDSFNALKKSAEAGAKRKRLFEGIDEDRILNGLADELPEMKRAVINSMQGCGLSERETLSAAPLAVALAAAVPIILAMKKVFKGTGADDPSVGGDGLEGILTNAKDAAVAAGILPGEIVDPTSPQGKAIYEPEKGDDTPKKDGEIFGMPKALVYGGGALLALKIFKVI